MTGSGIETEVKLRVADKTAMLERLRQASLKISAERQFEANTVYDTKDRTLRRAGMLLRLRQTRGTCTLTWKGHTESAPHKRRPELETTAGSCETLHEIFLQLGFEPLFRYEKYRTEFTGAQGSGLVVLDETPIGDFLELEGPAGWIDRTALLLGFSPSDYILESYAKLYLLDCERRGVQPRDMTFASLEQEDEPALPREANTQQ